MSVFASGQRLDPGTQRSRGPALPPDHLADVFGMHSHLQHPAVPQLLVTDSHVVRMGDDALDQVLERISQHDQASSAGVSSLACTASAAGASCAGASVLRPRLLIASVVGSPSASASAALNLASL